jgi:hypothetical protein
MTIHAAQGVESTLGPGAAFEAGPPCVALDSGALA